MEESDYLNRFSQDIEKVLVSHRNPKKSRSSVYRRVGTEIRKVCETEIMKVHENNVDLAEYVQKFSNSILTRVSELENQEFIEDIKSFSKVELLEQMLETVNREIDRDVVEKYLQEDNTDGGRAPGERPEKIRNVGERPESLKNIRNALV